MVLILPEECFKNGKDEQNCSYFHVCEIETNLIHFDQRVVNCACWTAQKTPPLHTLLTNDRSPRLSRL